MERFSEWMLWIGWRRVMFTLLAAPLVALVAWWLLRLPPSPIESMIPVAPTVAPKADVTSDASSSGWLPPLDTVAPERVAVHVVGAVMRPGVYHLVAGARADDALRAAGGASPQADLRRVNLAATVHDGEQLVIPRVGERITTPPSGGSGTSGSRAPTTTVPLIIDINAATADDFDRLPGVGPTIARAIVEHRKRNGPFASVDELLAVRGIGPAKLAEMRPWVRV
jgi:competence protein ComEA